MTLTKQEWDEYWQLYQIINQVGQVGRSELQRMEDLENKMSDKQHEFKEWLEELDVEEIGDEEDYWNTFGGYVRGQTRKFFPKNVKVKQHKRRV